MTNQPTDGSMESLQYEVQRLLGRCLLRLQQYERLIKALVANHHISGPAAALASIQTKRAANIATKTLGNAVGAFLGSYITSNELASMSEAAAHPSSDSISIGVTLQVVVSAEEFSLLEGELKELVALRNNLVHHFIDQHDLLTPDGCRDAQAVLIAAYNRIDQYFEQLRGWAKHADQLTRMMAEYLQTDAFVEWVVNGVAPNGTVDWPVAGIVRALRSAAAELAIDGWTPVTKAARWIAQKHPEQLPAKYGCSSWRQVLHESRLFEIQRREVDGQRSAWFRAKVDAA